MNQPDPDIKSLYYSPKTLSIVLGISQPHALSIIKRLQHVDLCAPGSRKSCPRVLKTVVAQYLARQDKTVRDGRRKLMLV